MLALIIYDDFVSGWRANVALQHWLGTLTLLCNGTSTLAD